MKKYCLLLALLSCLGAVRANPFHAVSAELDAGGTYYRIGTHSAMNAVLRNFARECADLVMKSSLEPESKAEFGFCFDLFDALFRLSGLDSVAGSGGSSVLLRAADGKTNQPALFHNKFCLLHQPGAYSGLVWSLFGPAERPLDEMLGEWPGNALAAASAVFDARGVYAALDGAKLVPEELKNFLKAFGVADPAQFFGQFGECAGAALFPASAPGTPFDFAVAVSDREGGLFAFFKRWSAMLPDAREQDGKLFLPVAEYGEGTFSPVVFRHRGRLIYASSPVVAGYFTGNTPRLGADRSFAALRLRMPPRGFGFVWIGGALAGRVLPAVCEELRNSTELPALFKQAQFAVLGRCRDGLKIYWNASVDGNLAGLAAGGTLPGMLVAESLIPVIERARGRAENAGCLRNCRAIGEAFKKYAADHRQRYPALNDVAGLRELVTRKYLDPAKLRCPGARDTPAAKPGEFSEDNCSYIYFSGFGTQDDPNLPLLFDWPLNHEDEVNVLFVDGRVEHFEIEHATTCKKIVSYLQSRFNYPEKVFRALLRRAERFDKLYELE